MHFNAIGQSARQCPAAAKATTGATVAAANHFEIQDFPTIWRQIYIGKLQRNQRLLQRTILSDTAILSNCALYKYSIGIKV